MPESGPLLVLVPTALERRVLAELGGADAFPAPVVCGFGPVSAAARTAQLLAERRPRRACLIGIAGALGEHPLGSALAFGRVRLDGVGVGSGAAFRPASELGFPQWEDERGGRIDEGLELLPLRQAEAELLTVCAASASPAEARARRERYPAAAAEDMEGFGVALACRLFGVELIAVRGLSNRAGERDPGRWRVREALGAARALLVSCLAAERA